MIGVLSMNVGAKTKIKRFTGKLKGKGWWRGIALQTKKRKKNIRKLTNGDEAPKENKGK